MRFSWDYCAKSFSPYMANYRVANLDNLEYTNTNFKKEILLWGWVKFPTGGKAREPYGRSGDIPGPTVKSG